ncbi:hypothetical protein AC249_AIPGENE18514 [Exaiptasia diaphana]|nr:hypothetical protein AC249_AIPGENE18514 [Exaiptasia diaphana]
MASVEDSNDLLFLESVLVSEDEIDAVSTFFLGFEKDSEIPPKYFMRKFFSPHREPPCHFDPAEERILRRKKILTVSIVNPKPCYLELSGSSDEGQQLSDKLSAILVTFSSKFSYLSLREPIQKGGNGTSPSTSPQVKSRKLDLEGVSSVPAFGMMMIFTARAQKNADTLLGRIKSSSEWKEITMPKQISEEDELHFDLSNKSEVLFSVKQGSPFAGIKVTVFVNENFEEMERFYSLITGKSPLAYNKIEEGLCLRTYSLSSKLELQLVLHPTVESHNSSNVALCFAVEDITKLLSEIPGGVRNIGEDQWQLTDPDGNSVILYSLLK